MSKKKRIGSTPQNEPSGPSPAPPETIAVTGAGRWFAYVVLGLAALLAIWALSSSIGQDRTVADFAVRGWGDYARVIVRNQIDALWHAAFLTALVGTFLWLAFRSRKLSCRGLYVAAACVVLAVAADGWWLSRKYIQTLPKSALDENAVIQLLKKDMPEHRVALTSQDGFYNWWLTYLFPFHGIQTVNITQMPRMPDDYKKFLETVGRNPIRFWQLSAVGYVLAPSQVKDQLEKDPRLQGLFHMAYSYNIVSAEGGGVSFVPAMVPASAQHVVLRFNQPGPRYALIGAWEAAADDATLKRLSAPEYVPFRSVMVTSNDLSRLPPSGETGMVGRVELKEYRPGLIRLKTVADRPSILRLSEHFDPDWKSLVDEKPAGILRVDYLFQGVSIPGGTHDVVLRYSPTLWPVAVQASGLLACLGVAVALLLGAIRRTIRNRGPAHATEPTHT